jgi:hypothetical protein
MRSVTLTTLAGLLCVGACNSDELVTDPGPFASHGIEEEGETGSADDGTGEDADQDAAVDPAARILWIAEEGGDLLVHATLGPAAKDAFPEGVRHELRWRSGGDLYGAVVDAHGEALELWRLARRDATIHPGADPKAVQLCFPLPVLPPIVGNCWAQPCPWDEGWPLPDGGWPNCVEIGSGDAAGSLRIVGAVDGTPVGREVSGDAIEDLFDVTPTPGRVARLGRLAVLQEDSIVILGELEPLELPCLECLQLGTWIGRKALGCVTFDLQACKDAADGYGVYDEECAGGCG